MRAALALLVLALAACSPEIVYMYPEPEHAVGEVEEAALVWQPEPWHIYVFAAATVRQIKYRKPSGATGTWTAVLTGTSTLRYITLAGDIDEAGPWQFQPYAERPDWSGHGRARTVEVGDTLD